MKKIILLFFIALLLAGCTMFTKTVYVPQGDAVKLRETIEKVDVWIKPANTDPIAGNMTIYEGWY